MYVSAQQAKLGGSSMRPVADQLAAGVLAGLLSRRVAPDGLLGPGRDRVATDGLLGRGRDRVATDGLLGRGRDRRAMDVPPCSPGQAVRFIHAPITDPGRLSSGCKGPTGRSVPTDLTPSRLGSPRSGPLARQWNPTATSALGTESRAAQRRPNILDYPRLPVPLLVTFITFVHPSH
jgi:hypothetical protein